MEKTKKEGFLTLVFRSEIGLRTYVEAGACVVVPARSARHHIPRPPEAYARAKKKARIAYGPRKKALRQNDAANGRTFSSGAVQGHNL